MRKKIKTQKKELKKKDMWIWLIPDDSEDVEHPGVHVVRVGEELVEIHPVRQPLLSGQHRGKLIFYGRKSAKSKWKSAKKSLFYRIFFL